MLRRALVVSRRLPLSRGMASSAPVQAGITAKLTEELSPEHLEVINESGNHNVPKGSETHFKVVVVSRAFENHKLIERHRMVNGLLEEQFGQGLHALSIVAKTPEQWSKSNKVEPSPKCRGGSGL